MRIVSHLLFGRRPYPLLISDISMNFPIPELFADSKAAIHILKSWRRDGPDEALRQIEILSDHKPSLSSDPLQQEMRCRLTRNPGPKIVVDGIWLSRRFGGISRVWQLIFRSWNLPGLVNEQAPIYLINRGSNHQSKDSFSSIAGSKVDPLDFLAVASIGEENASFVDQLDCDVFLSTWVSSAGKKSPVCSELALVHDCLPERYGSHEPLKFLRKRWLKGAAGHLAVSADTAADLEKYLGFAEGKVIWCHSGPSDVFGRQLFNAESNTSWNALTRKAGLHPPYVLLPATSAVGSYKNPEVLLEALNCEGLDQLQLVLCGIGADKRCNELERKFPYIRSRCIAAGFTDDELALAYHYAHAVVIPSHIEGFGLPVIEALATGALVLISDARGLREAGGTAAMRFQSSSPKELAALLRLFLDPTSYWIRDHIVNRKDKRLDLLNPDLLGITLLAIARSLL